MNQLTAKEQALGYRLLFDGETLNHWVMTEAGGWAVEDGAIVCLPQGKGYLRSEEQFEDFILELDYKFGEGVNSGIFFRWTDIDDPINTAFEMQVKDTYQSDPPLKNDCGALYDLKEPKVSAVKKAGEWNHAIVHCKGPRIILTLNDIEVVNVDIDDWTEPGKNPDGTDNKFKYAWSTMPRKGYLGLQDHGGKVWYRNIKIREL